MRTVKKLGISLVVFLSVVLVACGRDVSSVEQALEGTWTISEAYLNNEPLVDVLEENAAWFDIDESDFTTNEDGEVEYDVACYYNEGVLQVVNSDGETIETDYNVLSADDEKGTMRLEYTIAEEDVTVVLQEDVTFIGEERETKTSAIHILDIQMALEASETATEVEEQWEVLGQEIVRELLRSIELTLHFDYVGEEAPAAVQAE